MRYVATCLLLLLAGCEREKRVAQVSPGAASLPTQPRLIELQPGVYLNDADTPNPYEGNYSAMNEGQRLYSWFNCAGCHSPGGGGGIGPPLIDDQWIYGNKPANIYDTIVRGRPNGMPSFGGKIPSYQIWQLVTYVRSMSAQKQETPK
jgi:cytochrome c oxidase cbb3-type subunit III